VSPTTTAVLFVFGAGIAAAIQVAVNGRLGARIGTLEAATFQSLIAVSLFLVTTLAVRGGLGGVFSGFRAPVWMWLGGAMGFVIVSAITYAPGRISNLAVAGVLIAAQLLMAALIDAFGLFGFERLGLPWERLAGIALLAAGATLVLKR
jgi:bacterial/archaeal transporter family-2 protein